MEDLQGLLISGALVLFCVATACLLLYSLVKAAVRDGVTEALRRLDATRARAGGSATEVDPPTVDAPTSSP